MVTTINFLPFQDISSAYLDASNNRSSSGSVSGEECGGGGATGGGAVYKELDVDGAVVEVEQCETVDPECSVVFVRILFFPREL